MNELDKDLKELRRRLDEGMIQRAYRGIISYMSRLRTVLAAQYGGHAVSVLYQGYLDMTYFALIPDNLKKRSLKLAIVFNYESFQFEIWLAARNRRLQHHHWKLFSDAAYTKHTLVAPAAGVDAILKAVLAADYSLGSEDSLTGQIAELVKAFERDVEEFLDKLDVKQSLKE
jgi:hypothetical protein